MFQVLEGADGGELNVLGPPGQGAVVRCTNGVQNGGSQESDTDNVPGLRGGNQQLGLVSGHQLVDQRREVPLRIPLRGTEGHGRVLAEEPLEQSITGMLIALSLEVKGGFETSNANQKEIRGLCETLGEKIDEFAGRTASLEEEVGDLRTAVERNKVEIQSLRTGEESVLSKLESLENNKRRNNLRFLKVPEGMEGGDLKGFIVCLIKQEAQVEDTEDVIARDIQRVHRDPFRKLPNEDKPMKILVCLNTYAIKERILSAALKKRLLKVEGTNFEIRSDLSSVTLNKQWELGRRIEVLKGLGATAQLKFPATLKVMASNKMYNFRDCKEVDELIKTLEKRD
ncbi:hypothetical protein NDU88_003657 [Pleurodeles waltl]|uniref:L1 transposable element RRM domain-containing protein n=1 Tax=Pleurodeles waltl TaxID=8319 RepID=A0AAV7NH06_PLEWA|nr:hypothetical protein NDU88_003657 [Pleurodeles waltl]